MTRRLWVVSELYHPEETSTGWFLTRIAEGLSDDFEVHVICSRPTYSERDAKVPWFERRCGVAIHRMRSTRFAKDAMPGRLANLVSFTLAATLFALGRVRRGDRLLVVTNPPAVPPLMAIVARLKGARAVLLVHDVYPEVLTATHVISAGGLAERMIGSAAAATYRLYNRVVVLGRDMRELVRARLGPGLDHTVIIANWGEVEEIVPLPPAGNAFARAHNPRGATVIQFSGNLGRTHNIEAVLDAARRVSGQSEILFQFIGDGGKGRLLRDAAGEGQCNIAVLSRQPREHLNGMLAGADAIVIGFVDGMYGVSVPSRMYNVMAAGTPIIAMAHARSELALVIMEEDCGWVLAPDDAAGLAALARRLATPEGARLARAKGARARAAAVRRFSMASALHEYQCLYAALEDEPKRIHRSRHEFRHPADPQPRPHTSASRRACEPASGGVTGSCREEIE